MPRSMMAKIVYAIRAIMCTVRLYQNRRFLPVLSTRDLWHAGIRTDRHP